MVCMDKVKEIGVRSIHPYIKKIPKFRVCDNKLLQNRKFNTHPDKSLTVTIELN